MFADETLPNTTEEKHQFIIKQLNRQMNETLREIRYGATPKQDDLTHIQKQIRFHRNMIITS